MIKKILENNFIKSTFILLIGGSLSKALGFVMKIIITRKIGSEGVILYSLLSPTMGLLTIIAIFSFPIGVSYLTSLPGKSSKKVLAGAIPISIVLNSVIIIIVVLFSSFISNDLLHDSRLYYPIICTSLILPFISLSSIIKGYFWGKQNMFPYMLSNVVEQIVRILILIFLLPITLKYSIVLTICTIILVNIISETSSIIVMLLFMKKNTIITKKDLFPNKKDIKDVLGICIPATSSKIVGSIAYFFEPIILTNTLLLMGYSSTYILREYGIINGYSLALLLLPNFFTQSISTSLVPELSKHYSRHDKKKCIKRVKQITLLSFLIGFIFTFIIYLFPKELLSILFKTTEGAKYIKILAPFTLLYFIEVPLINSLQAINKARLSMNITIISSIIRLSLLFILSLLKIGIYSLIYTIIINLIITTYLNYHYTMKELK